MNRFLNNVDTEIQFYKSSINKFYTNFGIKRSCVISVCRQKLPQLKIFLYFDFNLSILPSLSNFHITLPRFMSCSWASSNKVSPTSFFTRSLQAVNFGRPSNILMPVAANLKSHYNYMYTYFCYFLVSMLLTRMVKHRKYNNNTFYLYIKTI